MLTTTTKMMSMRPGGLVRALMTRPGVVPRTGATQAWTTTTISRTSSVSTLSSSSCSSGSPWNHPFRGGRSMSPVHRSPLSTPTISSVRAMSASTSSSSAATDALVDILGREYDEEQTNETTAMPAELQELYQSIQDKGWKIVEDDGGATTRLFATRGPRKVQIYFHCQDTVVEEDDAYDEEDNDAEEEEPAPSFRFTVIVSKAGKSLVMVCVSKEAQCAIESTTVTTTDMGDLTMDAATVPATEYQGPEFYELAADLQDALEGFLTEEIGIDQDMCAFVSMHADYREQCAYVNFLDSAKTLLS